MTTLLVVILVLIVISLALDVLILASIGNLIAQLFNPKPRPVFNVDARGAASPEAVEEAVKQAVRRSRYDA